MHPGFSHCAENLVLLCLQQATGEGMTDEERKLRQQKAMADPEIQNILTDPVMRQVSMPGAARCTFACVLLRSLQNALWLDGGG